MTRADLVLHPVRLRVLQAFLGRRALTTGQLAAELSDVPPASLYRHVGRLVEAGILAAVAERRVRGTVERTYELRVDQSRITAEELSAMTADQHRHAFRVFVAGLVGEFNRYLSGGDIDLVRDRVRYALNAFWLDDRELDELVAAIDQLLLPYVDAPRPGRTRRLLASVLLPVSGSQE